MRAVKTLDKYGEDDPGRATLTVPQAGAILGIGRNSAYDAARKGEIPTIRIGGRILVPRTRFERLLDGVKPSDR